jgi:hypothetical protein
MRLDSILQDREVMTITAYQLNIEAWTHACFGADIATNVHERNYRFLEESLELVQAGGLSKEEALAMVNHVFDRPPGELEQEVGGTIVTLASFCNARKISLEAAAVTELNSVIANIDRIREKHKNKKLKIA